MTAPIAVLLNALGLFGIALILAVAFAFQLAWHELPCPLCLLQRVMFVALAVGPILNIRYGPKPAHYAMGLLAALVGFTVSSRQVMLHILPGDAGYGSAILGLHFYTWGAVIFVAAIALIAIMLLFERQFEIMPVTSPPPVFAIVAVWAIIALTAANGVSTFLECGLTWCADNPLRYELLVGKP
jgi:disulfide bond formation protein DsbB